MVPYAILGVPFEADDLTIREAYLNRIKTTSPDRDPEGFKRLAWAYRSIAKAEDRRQLFLDRPSGGLTDAEIDDTFEHIREVWTARCRRPPSFEAMMEQWRKIPIHG